MFPNKTSNLFLNKTRNFSLLPRWTVSARPGPVLGPAQSILTGPQISLSALALDCLCQKGLTPWSVSLPFPRTILLFLLLCKIMFPGPVGALT